MSADDLCSSLVGWFRDRPDDVIEEIARQSGALPGIPLRLPGMRRMDPVSDATLRRDVPMAAQRLIRWTTTPPTEAFVYGFQPRVFPSANQFPARAFNLRSYVLENHDSIFVSTTQPYINQRNALDVWERRIIEDNWQRFEYEIFAYGGIDVNRAIGQHRFANQREVAFAGGIRPEMIRSAREYIGTRIIQIWINTHFDNTLNPPGHNPPLAELPPAFARPFTVHLREYPDPNNPAPLPPHPDHDEMRRRRSVKNVDDDIAMFPGDDGAGVRDALLDIKPLPFTNVACVRDPTNWNRAYFFCGNRYVVININPGTTGETIAWGPKNIVDNWPSLWKAGFTTSVDAILPHPDASHEMYFFSGDQYALINIAPGTTNDWIIGGPKKISTEWPSLKQAKFDKIDAILPSPANRYEAYFFSGTQYALIRFRPGTTSDYIVGGPKPILDNWPSLKRARFNSVTAILPNPANRNEAYFFSGDQYALINIAPGSTSDYIVNGPKLVRTEWPSLKQAGFW